MKNPFGKKTQQATAKKPKPVRDTEAGRRFDGIMDELDRNRRDQQGGGKR